MLLFLQGSSVDALFSLLYLYPRVVCRLCLLLQEGYAPIHRAAIKSQCPCISALAAAGADLNSLDQFGDTALHYAVFVEDIDVIRLLLSLGVDVNRKNKVGRALPAVLPCPAKLTPLPLSLYPTCSFSFSFAAPCSLGILPLPLPRAWGKALSLFWWKMQINWAW